MTDTPMKRGRGRPPKNPIPTSSAGPEKSRTIVITRPMLKQWLKVVAAIVVLAVVGVLVWQYMSARNDVRRLSNPQNATQAANDEITRSVSKIAVVPGNEKPTIADVSDASKLKGQPLFDQVRNGDKVLLYTQARREVVYRPSTKQIVTIVTLPAQDSSGSTQNAQ